MIIRSVRVVPWVLKIMLDDKRPGATALATDLMVAPVWILPMAVSPFHLSVPRMLLTTTGAGVTPPPL